jgi:acyl-CoA synthetase (AMP-forming)/AMP-acid ligase II
MAISAQEAITRMRLQQESCSQAAYVIAVTWLYGIQMVLFRFWIEQRTLSSLVSASTSSHSLVTRLTDLAGGENISSVALESMLITHPDILECGVAGVADSHWGERPKAYITVKSGAKLTGEDVIKFAKEHPGISRFAVPREVEVVDELPKTSTGKIRKNVLREWSKGSERQGGSE